MWRVQPRFAFSSPTATPASAALIGSRSAVEPEDRDLRSPDFTRKSGRYVASRHRDFLGAVHCISDHPAGDRAADLLTPQLVAGYRIKRIEIAAHVAEEHKAAGRRRHAAEDR